MSKSKQSVRTWKEIRQAINPRTLSKEGRLRRILFYGRMGGIGLLLALAGWGIFQGASAWESYMSEFRTAGETVPVREVVVITDGVLTQSWVEGMLQLPAQAGLMDLDLAYLQQRLVRHGQIRTAVLTREFPDTLVVKLQERFPVMRLLAELPGKGREILLISPDGVVFPGIGYQGLMISYLPYLDGVSLRREGEGFAPVEGMSRVADLLQTAQLEAPHLYRSWKIVSLKRLQSFDEILVRTRDVPQITFNRRDDFRRQLAQLDYVLDAVSGQPVPESIDLSLGRQVAVEFGPPSGFPQQGFRNQQRKIARDL